MGGRAIGRADRRKGGRKAEGHAGGRNKHHGATTLVDFERPHSNFHRSAIEKKNDGAPNRQAQIHNHPDATAPTQQTPSQNCAWAKFSRAAYKLNLNRRKIYMKSKAKNMKNYNILKHVTFFAHF